MDFLFLQTRGQRVKVTASPFHKERQKKTRPLSGQESNLHRFEHYFISTFIRKNKILGEKYAFFCQHLNSAFIPSGICQKHGLFRP
jgi:hypothetical protein